MYPQKDLTKYLISTPAYFKGSIKDKDFYIKEAYPNYSLETYVPFSSERIYRHYLDLTARTPLYKEGELVIPNYSPYAETFCIALSVLFGKRFDSHGLLIQHGDVHVPSLQTSHNIVNKNLTFNSSNSRVDFSLELDLSNFSKIKNVIFGNEPEKVEARSTFFYAGRFYVQSLRIAEENPEIAFLSLITCGEIISKYFKYEVEELIDESTRELFARLKSIVPDGDAIYRKVKNKVLGISATFCKYTLDCLDDQFFQKSEAKNHHEKLTKDEISLRLKAAYDIRSKYVHAGKAQLNWMSINYKNDNPEIIHGKPIIEDSELQKIITRSPTFIGLERIIRYSLIKFLIKTNLIEDFSTNG
jgi:hypothetical protein